MSLCMLALEEHMYKMPACVHAPDEVHVHTGRMEEKYVDAIVSDLHIRTCTCSNWHIEPHSMPTSHRSTAKNFKTFSALERREVAS